MCSIFCVLEINSNNYSSNLIIKKKVSAPFSLQMCILLTESQE